MLPIKMSEGGYFPRGISVLRRVQEERAVGLHYGQRALLVGALHPVNFTGTSQSTLQRERPWRRLTHTGRAFETIFFGSRAEADEVLAMVRKMHERVKGTLDVRQGPYPAGTTYSAFDPKLMLWTIAVMADSAEVFHDLLVRKLVLSEREALWRDYVRFGELFGMPRDVAPPSYVEFRRWFAGMLNGPELHLTPYARSIGMQVAFSIPLPAVLAGPNAIQNLIQLGSLPARVRELYGLSWSAPQEAAFRGVAAWFRQTRRFVPALVRRGYNTEAFDLIDREEARRLRSGKPAMRTAMPSPA